ncbi:MAG: LPS assembly lipoprotein LptE [candidate division KSB1 bacterium]|nr:LPS assembly lipoprotein LptE [candidate division KSB1 bacterium]
MKKNSRNSIFIVLGIIIAFQSCAYYSLKGSLPPHLKTVAVPLFENQTSEFGIAEKLTDTVINELVRDGSLKIADRSAADVLIEGTITSVNDRPGAFSQEERVQDINIYISVSVKVTDQVKQTVMWDERLTQFGVYDPSSGPEGRQQAYEEAFAKISQEILNKTVSTW